ncbi:hypothetical protein Tco_1050750 [Tanacetum coccineum]
MCLLEIPQRRASDLESKWRLNGAKIGAKSARRDRRDAWSYKLFKGQIEAIQDEQVKVLSGRVAELDSELMKYLAVLGETIGRTIDKGMQDGLVTGIDHRKAGRGLVDVVSYNPPVKASPASKTPEANQLQPSPEQLMLPIHRLEDQVVIGETSLSFFLDVVHARVQRIRGDVASRRLSLSDVMVLLIEPLSAENLVGEASTSGIPAMATTTALSTTFTQTSSVPLIYVADYEVLARSRLLKFPLPQRLCLRRRSWRLHRSMLRPIKPVAIVTFSVMILSLHHGSM